MDLGYVEEVELIGLILDCMWGSGKKEGMEERVWKVFVCVIS